MREMRERIMTEGYHRTKGTLEFSLKQVELMPSPDEKAEGFFEITGTPGVVTEGFVRARDERMQCLTPYFNGSREQIEYRFDARDMQDGETRRGRFLVISNHGEYELPWKVTVRKKPAESSLGEIRNLFHFTNLARANWQEAVKFFYTKEFKRICGEEKEDLFNLYRGLSQSFGNESNVEEFLVAVKKKQPISFSAVRKEICITDMKGRVSEEIQIMKNGWGPIHFQAEAKGSFLTLEKSWIGEDDFLGNLCRVPVFMDESRMHAGRNFGEVVFTGTGGSFSVTVTVERRTLRARARDRRSLEEKKCNMRMVNLYQQLRMKKLDMEKWRIQARECVEEMAHLTEKRAVPKLFSAQLLITEDRMEEAGWILEHVEPLLDREDPAVYCYFLYLTTLYNREESDTRRTTEEVKAIFRQNPGEWRIAWLLLFLSGELNRSASKKWAFLEARFREGCTSPVLYLEALQVLNVGPALLMKLDGIAKRVLMYGARNGILGADLAGHVAELAEREKYYDPILFEILKLIWEKRPDPGILQAICSLLIKGGKTGPAYYGWYLKGVEKKLRITRLYEYYLMSIDLNRDVEIPKIVLLYFAYQSNLEYEYAAYLYAYVEKHKEEDPDLYITYRPQIDRFVLDCLYKGRISRHLASLYTAILTGPMLTKENERALAELLCTVEITCNEKGKKKLVVVHARLKGEKAWVMNEGCACVDLYSGQDMLFLEDEARNRRLINEEVQKRPLFEKYARPLSAAGDVLTCHLAAADVEQIVVRPENAASYLAIVREPVLTSVYGRRVRIALLRFLREQDRTEELDGLLKELEKEDVDPADRMEVVRCLVLQGFYEKAYAWLEGADFGQLDARIGMRLCSRLLEQQLFTEEGRLTSLCFFSALNGKYDGRILQQLNSRYEGSIPEMEALREAAEGFGINTYPLCERIMEQMLFTDRDVTERTDLLRQYVQEGGRSELEGAFLHRCAYSYVMENQPVHVSVIFDILRMHRAGERITDMCRMACLQYYARNRDAMDAGAEEAVKKLGEELLASGRIVPVLKEFADLIPGAELLLDKTFVVFKGKPDQRAVLNYRILRGSDVIEDYQSMEMQHVYEGISVTAFILFPGESLQYFVTDAKQMKEIEDSGILKAEECIGAAEESRYGMLGAVTARHLSGQLAENGQWQSLELLNRYLYTDYCVRALFKPLG